MAIDLGDAWDKLRWAEKHFDALRSQIEPFEKRDTHSISFKVDAEAGKYTFYVHGLDVPNPDWGLMIGDCIHNARTALDYLMVRLVALVTGEDPAEIDGVDFPIYDDPKRFAGAMGKVRNMPAFSGYLTRIEELQPFNALNTSIWGLDEDGLTAVPAVPNALARLSGFDNIDKHRVVHAAWFGPVLHGKTALEPPAGFKGTGGSIFSDPLVDGAPIGEMSFETPLPCEWHPDEMKVKRQFPLQIAFGEPTLENGVLKVLPFCLAGVEATLGLFDPVFTHLAPPLPVATTIRKSVRASTEKG